MNYKNTRTDKVFLNSIIGEFLLFLLYVCFLCVYVPYQNSVTLIRKKIKEGFVDSFIVFISVTFHKNKEIFSPYY